MAKSDAIERDLNEIFMKEGFEKDAIWDFLNTKENEALNVKYVIVKNSRDELALIWGYFERTKDIKAVELLLAYMLKNDMKTIVHNGGGSFIISWKSLSIKGFCTSLGPSNAGETLRLAPVSHEDNRFPGRRFSIKEYGGVSLTLQDVKDIVDGKRQDGAGV